MPHSTQQTPFFGHVSRRIRKQHAILMLRRGAEQKEPRNVAVVWTSFSGAPVWRSSCHRHSDELSRFLCGSEVSRPPHSHVNCTRPTACSCAGMPLEATPEFHINTTIMERYAVLPALAPSCMHLAQPESTRRSPPLTPRSHLLPSRT